MSLKTDSYINIYRDTITIDTNCVERKSKTLIKDNIYICLYEGKSTYKPDDLNLRNPIKSYKLIIDNPISQWLVVNDLLIIKECDVLDLYDCDYYLWQYFIDIIKCYSNCWKLDNLQLEVHKVC